MPYSFPNVYAGFLKFSYVVILKLHFYVEVGTITVANYFIYCVEGATGYAVNK